MKQTSSFRRFVCLLLTLAMLLSLGTTALAASPALLLHYDFAGDEGTAVSDKAGSYDGTLTVSGSGEARLVSGADRDGGAAALPDSRAAIWKCLQRRLRMQALS